MAGLGAARWKDARCSFLGVPGRGLMNGPISMEMCVYLGAWSGGVSHIHARLRFAQAVEGKPVSSFVQCLSKPQSAQHCLTLLWIGFLRFQAGTGGWGSFFGGRLCNVALAFRSPYLRSMHRLGKVGGPEFALGMPPAHVSHPNRPPPLSISRSSIPTTR